MTGPGDPHGEAEGLASSVCFLDQQNVAPYAQDWPAVAHWRQAERERLRAERLALSVEARQVKAEALAHYLTALLSERCGDLAGRVLSGYWPIKGELDLRPWMTSLHAKGAVLAFPVVETPRAPLTFRRWEPGMRMERGHWGIAVPPEASQRLTPEICLAPLVGWDSAGYRLGYGGGYFDRTLASLSPRPLVTGVGLQSARLDSIAPQTHDVPMSVVVTEPGVQVEGSGWKG